MQDQPNTISIRSESDQLRDQLSSADSIDPKNPLKNLFCPEFHREPFWGR